MSRQKVWLKIAIWIDKRRAFIVIVGFLIGAASNYFHNDIEERSGVRSSLANAMSDYKHETLTIMNPFYDETTKIVDINSGKISYNEKLIRVLPSLNRLNNELTVELIALSNLADHVKGAEQEKVNADDMQAVSARLSGLYKDISFHLEGRFDHIPKEPPEAETVVSMAKAFHSQYLKLIAGFHVADLTLSDKAKAQLQQQEAASAAESDRYRKLTYFGLALPLLAIIKPPEIKTTTGTLQGGAMTPL